jgi:hypothetical protein
VIFFEQMELWILVLPAPLPPTDAAGIQSKSTQLQLYTLEAASLLFCTGASVAAPDGGSPMQLSFSEKGLVVAYIFFLLKKAPIY